jgi:hypothetical protein
MTNTLRIRSALTAFAAVAITSVSAFILPAHAATTTTTFTLTGGALSISAPGSASLGSAATDAGTITASLGSVTASDGRGALAGSWTATALSSAFTTGGQTANETIAATNASYWSGALTSVSGTAVRVPGQLLVANAVAIDTAKTAASASATVGNNVTSWSPTLIVALPAQSVVGLYTGTITHSIA